MEEAGLGTGGREEGEEGEEGWESVPEGMGASFQEAQ